MADKDYDGDRFRESLLLHGILSIIPPKSDRNRVERMFGFLGHQRRIATRYDKTALSFASFLNIAAARLCLKSYVSRTQASPVNRTPITAADTGSSN